ncbi:MAG TPA: hypothetical protein VEZ20_09985 [Allosphingosinicella sp.]|nr:hypothetical protein [Allosphingosinicella sp.]
MRRRLAAGALAAAFALSACASAPAEGGSAAAAAGLSLVRLGEEVRLGGLGVRALRLVEDSRCPAGVQCIHAGTVRLAVRLSEAGARRETILNLNEPAPLAGGRSLRLVAVCPATWAPGMRPPERAYSFLIAAGPQGAEAPPQRPCGPT